MRLLLLAASNRQPDWVVAGYREYAGRLRGRFVLELKEVKLARRTGGASVAQAVADEGERLLAAVPDGAHVVALSERGAPWSTADLAARLERWSALGAPVCLLLGGPDGLAPRCLERAAEQWCLSPLTLPHGLARIIVAEALYRAWSLLERHPYHRA
ncbi:MAG TPA: 23S rRNA (pseudouridine(1915)-N(3))-methyltransferase RlmH [Gammaproteobacteria bacterium]